MVWCRQHKSICEISFVYVEIRRVKVQSDDIRETSQQLSKSLRVRYCAIDNHLVACFDEATYLIIGSFDKRIDPFGLIPTLVDFIKCFPFVGYLEWLNDALVHYLIKLNHMIFDTALELASKRRLPSGGFAANV